MDLEASLDLLPSSSNYEFSFMHQTTISHVLSSSSLNTIATLSIDGIVKFWKKNDKSIELLRSFSFSPVLSSAGNTKLITNSNLTRDERYFVTCSSGSRSIHLFDFLNCEMISYFEVDFDPSFVFGFIDLSKELKVICLERNSCIIRIYNPFENTVIAEYFNLHKRPVISVSYCQLNNYFVSLDETGMIEYWSIDGKFPTGLVEFSFKSQTDLYCLVKSKVIPYSLQLSSNDKYFAVLSNDFIIRIFILSTGKLVRTITERPSDCFNEPSIIQRITKTEQSIDIGLLRNQSIIFDPSSQFIIYPNFVGIKICAIEESNSEFDKTVGWDEKIRFINLALYQGNPTGKLITLELAASQNPASQNQYSSLISCLFCTGIDKNRIYLISRNDPKRDPTKEEGAILPSRDIQNERIELPKLSLPNAVAFSSENFAVLHTDLGDIKIEVFGEKTPKTVTNFITHCRGGYFNGVKFHRVIRDFMIQTGDPTGKGTGGESIWKTPFEDEFHPSLNMDKAFMVCMANSGPNSNGSQFFITTVPTPQLNGKHTVFGKVVSGFETVLKISHLATNKKNCPFDSVCIRDTEIKQE